VNWSSPCLSYLFNASSVAANIFTAPTCKATIINLEPCPLNAEFQHFILRFNKISLLYGYPQRKRKVWGWKEAQRQGDFIINFNICTYTSQNIYMKACKCIWQMFTLASCKCKKYMYTLQQDKCNCKIFEQVNVNDLHLHVVYTPIDTYMHNTG